MSFNIQSTSIYLIWSSTGPMSSTNYKSKYNLFLLDTILVRSNNNLLEAPSAIKLIYIGINT